MSPTAVSLVFIAAAGAVAAEVRFNRDIRPILSDRCFACHGPDKANRKTKMRLDIEADAKTDLGKGKFPLVAGDPQKSQIYQRIISTSKTLRMPPGYLGHDALQPAEAELLRQWIEQGAKYEPHWSFIPPKRPAIPSVRNQAWAKNPIDSFILSRLEREGLEPSPETDRRTLIRRVTFDLTGLPPTPGEVDAFLNDHSPNAYEKVVDRLLTTSRYGERMAVRWLEAARYADTNGYQTDGPRTMWRWRDWVIEAFNTDMPWDRFTIEQLAGDLLPNPTLSQQIATGFHRNHRTSAEGGIINEELRVEYVADRAETTSTVWLGLTVGCARCHDHKFDPISQKDFYSMFAFFNNVPERGFVWNFGNEDPIIRAPLPDQQKRMEELDRQVRDAQKTVSALQPRIDRTKREWERKLVRANSPLDWTVTKDQKFHAAFGSNRRFDGKDFYDSGAAEPKLDYRDPFTFAAWIKPETATGAILSRGEDYPEGQQQGLYLMDGKLRLHITFRWTDLALRLETIRPLPLNQWQHVAVTYDGAMKASGVHVYVNGEPQEVKILLDQLLWPLEIKQNWRVGAGGGLRFTGGIDDVRVYTRALTRAEIGVLTVREPVDRIAAISAKQRTPPQNNKLLFCFLETAAPPEVGNARAELDRITGQREQFLATVPTTMVMKDRKDVRETFLLKRGAYDAPGDKVPPAVPSALPQLPEGVPKDRLSLARWLVDRENPLTARATVNRWWAMLFGTGLVKTVEDFGSQGEWPAQPDLLDWLAVEFMDNGWSVKHIMRTLVTSASYRQSSRVTPELFQRDPENRLLARGPRFRLPAEMIRDNALAAAGLLVEKVGGPPVRPYQPAGLWQELQNGKGYEEDQGEGLYRRSLYTYWRRTVAPPNMVNFDAPTRETCIVRENRTNTPLQALNLMNDVAFVEAARKLAERILADGGATPGQRLDRAFQIVLARSPNPAEQKSLLRALASFQSYYDSHPKDAEAFLAHGKSPRNPSLNTPELAAYAGVASLVLNLDETITKE